MDNLPKNLDVLQNIEHCIVTVYRNNRELQDHNALKALDALNEYYRAKVKATDFEPSNLKDSERDIYDRVITVLAERKTMTDSASNEEAPKRKRFSRILKTPSPDEVYLSCIRKITKSAKGWNQRNGVVGYLQFIDQHVL